MKTLFDFLQMSPWERQEYVQDNGLSGQEREELLRINSVIASLCRMDAYRNGGGQPFKGEIKISVPVPGDETVH